MSPLRVLLADDDPPVRESLGSLLGAREDIELVAAVPDGLAALDAVARRPVDVALLDVEMPGLDGIETARRIAAWHPAIVVVMLTAFASDDFLDQALTAGASGFLTKDLPVARLADLLHEAARGGTVMGPRPTALLAEAYRSRLVQREEDPAFIAAVEALPGRLREVLSLLTHAASNRAIAAALGISEKTARMYASEILRRTGCRSRAEVAVRALNAGVGTATGRPRA